MLIMKENMYDQVHIFRGTYFESFQTHLQAIMYQFEHISHDIHQDFLFQILPILFGHAHNPHR